MFKKLVFLATIAVLLGSSLLLRLSSADAQQPCFPVAPYSTVCAPITSLVVVCPGQSIFNLPANNVLNQYYPFSAYYNGYVGQPFNGSFNYVNYGFNTYSVVAMPTILTVTNNQIANVLQVPEHPQCPANVPAAYQAPTPVPTPTIIRVEVPVVQAVQALAPSRQAVPLGEKAGIRPPSTGDAGLLLD